MELNRSKFRAYLDIIIFIILAITCCMFMLISIVFNDAMIRPALVFIYVYILNLLFYRICIEVKQTKFIHIVAFDLLASSLCILCLISTLMHVIYLIYFALQALYKLTFIEIISNHIIYATVVGSLFILHLASDNMTTFNNLYIKNIKN